MCLLGNFFLSLVVEISHWSFIFVQIPTFFLENLREVSYELSMSTLFPLPVGVSPFVVVGLTFLVGEAMHC